MAQSLRPVIEMMALPGATQQPDRADRLASCAATRALNKPALAWKLDPASEEHAPTTSLALTNLSANPLRDSCLQPSIIV